MKAKDISAVTRTIELLENHLPNSERWHEPQRDGATLEARLRSAQADVRHPAVATQEDNE